MATHSNILARRIPWTEDPGGLYSPWGHKESDTIERLTLSPFFHIAADSDLALPTPVPSSKTLCPCPPKTSCSLLSHGPSLLSPLPAWPLRTSLPPRSLHTALSCPPSRLTFCDWIQPRVLPVLFSNCFRCGSLCLLKGKTLCVPCSREYHSAGDTTGPTQPLTDSCGGAFSLPP